jgi:polysaccharide biosynthesis/export protein
MPFLGRVPAQDKTPQELAKIIAERLRGEYLNNPQVAVTVMQINSRTYFIQGAVNRPGLYQVEGQPSLFKLITVAGGLHENHGSTVFIIHEAKIGSGDKEAIGARRAEGSPAVEAAENRTNYELQQVSLNGLLRGNFDQNLAVEPGDIIYIPPADIFFVAGEVNAPGSFSLKEGTTLRQAISLAQGTTFKAVSGSSIIFRENPASGIRQEIPVDVGAVMRGKANDVRILANDIIIVPGSRLKSVTESILSAFGANAWRLRRGL